MRLAAWFAIGCLVRDHMYVFATNVAPALVYERGASVTTKHVNCMHACLRGAGFIVWR
jgi:hypothetical protein